MDGIVGDLFYCLGLGGDLVLVDNLGPAGKGVFLFYPLQLGDYDSFNPLGLVDNILQIGDFLFQGRGFLNAL